MRQSGILAAGALFALRNHRARLVEDHDKARRFAERTAEAPGLRVDLAQVETNIVNVDVEGALAERVSVAARARGLLLNPTGPRRLRAVMHLDVSPADGERAAGLLAEARRDAEGAS